MTQAQPVRRRDSAATKAAINAAARTLFARDSYDNVGIREIASLAGVDAALVSRYFGSKEELFAEVLCSGERGEDVIGSELEGLPERVADLLLDPDDEGKQIDDMLIILNSSSSPTAGGMVRDSINERFHGPFAEIIGGENAHIRAQLLGAMLLGVSISRQTSGNFSTDPDLLRTLKKRIADIVALAISPL